MMDKKTIQSGIIGSGFAASFHFESMRRINDTNVECVGVYSPNRAKDFAGERNIRAFESLEALIDACDVLHVCVPPAVHESVTLETRVANMRLSRSPSPVISETAMKILMRVNAQERRCLTAQWRAYAVSPRPPVMDTSFMPRTGSTHPRFGRSAK